MQITCVYHRVTDFSGVNAETGKAALRKAILAYHPDRQAGQGSSRKWRVLAEEITKVRSTILPLTLFAFKTTT